MPATLSLSVPATLANLGPGFDVLGMAVDVRNHFEFQRADTWCVDGEPVDPTTHLTLATAQRAAEDLASRCPPLSVRQREAVPRARGMGSSATARVAGLAAALHFTALEMPLDAQLAWLTAQEGHPDNVVPARVGGVTLCRWTCALDWHRIDAPDLHVALLIPRHEVSTEAARALLPAAVPLEDAVHNVASASFLVAGLAVGDHTLIRKGLTDRLHQPHRAPLIGPVQEADAAVRALGALGAVISGSGSTLAALCPDRPTARASADAMARCFADAGVPADTRLALPDSCGLRM